eukprot:4213492-Pleurochrysis_carterae.AAC.1
MGLPLVSAAAPVDDDAGADSCRGYCDETGEMGHGDAWSETDVLCSGETDADGHDAAAPDCGGDDAEPTSAPAAAAEAAQRGEARAAPQPPVRPIAAAQGTEGRGSTRAATASRGRSMVWRRPAEPPPCARRL